MIDAALRKIQLHFDVLDRAVAKTGCLVGTSMTLADINVLPILYYMTKLPESGELWPQGRRSAPMSSA